MEMNMMLSIPRTISRAVNVTSATHASGLVSHSNKCLPLYEGHKAPRCFFAMVFLWQGIAFKWGEFLQAISLPDENRYKRVRDTRLYPSARRNNLLNCRGTMIYSRIL